MPDRKKIRALLISNSYSADHVYFGHCAQELVRFLKGVGTLWFIPHAGYKLDADTDMVKNRFSDLGIQVQSLHQSQNPRKTLQTAEALFLGGGNTFRLLKYLYDRDLLRVIRERVLQGMPYMGSSAGSNVAGPTIQTTNDMPIVYPLNLAALNLVTININPHYLDPDPHSKHMGETREERIREFHQENERPVIGLREGSWLRVHGEEMMLGGDTGAKLFLKGEAPREIEPNQNLNFLLKSK